MKKVILSAAALLTMVSAYAENPLTGLNPNATVTATTVLPNWIDITDESYSQLAQYPTTWDQINYGWHVGDVTLKLSATRKAQIHMTATDMNDGANTAGHYFDANRLSIASSNGTQSGNIEAPLANMTTSFEYPTYNVVPETGVDAPVKVAQTAYGTYKHAMTFHLSAFITPGEAIPWSGTQNLTGVVGANVPGTYYNYNLIGGNYSTTLSFVATLN